MATLTADGLTADTRLENGLLVARLTGSLDHHSAEYARRFLLEAIGSAPVSTLVLDLAGIGFISSIGMGTMVHLQKVAKDRAKRLLLLGMPPRVREVFDLLGFTPYFSIIGSLEQAEPADPGFPSVQSCPRCGTRLRVARPGRFRCSRCRSVVRILDTGVVQAA